VLTIDWFDDVHVQASCPICHDTSAKGALGRYVATGAEPRTILLCTLCGTRFLDPLAAPPFVPMDPEVVRLYLEQSAGLDVMIEPIFRAAAAGARSLLEIGCGFGLALDFAQRAMGWSVRGFEPGPVGQMGARMLSVPIEPRLLTEEPVGEFDLVLASEVLEHIADPLALLRAARAQLSQRGCLALTTPNGEAIHSPITSVAMPALSPYQHLVLFSASSLRSALAQAGFPAVHVELRANTLIALAANDVGTIATVLAAPMFDPDVYLSYLDARIKSTTSGAFARGLAYRHFKTCMNLPRFNEVEGSLRRLRWLYFRTTWLDVGRPARAARTATEMPFGSERFARRVPYNLQGLFYFVGMLELNRRRHPEGAVAAFDASLACARHFRHLAEHDDPGWNGVVHGLRTDGENGDLHRLAVKHRLLALAHYEPHQAAEEALRHAQLEASDDEQLTQQALADLFDWMVRIGAHEASAIIAPALGKG
jgi:SAM-dependent methyltransferase